MLTQPWDYVGLVKLWVFFSEMADPRKKRFETFQIYRNLRVLRELYGPKLTHIYGLSCGPPEC